MRQRRWETGKRWATALLTLLAAFAFLIRGPVVSLLPEAQMVMSGMHMEHVGLPSPADHSGSQERHQQNHQAHCLFCLTGAFALEADTATPPPAPAVHQNLTPPDAAPSHAAVLRHTDARAPPARVRA
ncbi:DUF2946 family protein [Deinococcus aquatilis]|jgi:hypothetical protein|uniref:DUF2946 family protein n=1 Tax=Deinococcus aquatilis TaxID=519440 RepID=UPI000375A8F6|nr:DUF2946 family protein [Deinococcus aquatilis]